MWKKLGRIFEPKGQYWWVQSHASVPTPLCIKGDKCRIYFGGRNRDNKTQPGYLEIDLKNPFEILYLSPEPVLRLGKPGLFDDAAIWAHCIVEHKGALYLYYNGWVQGVSVPYYSTIGVAISKNGGKTFEKYSLAPIMDRTSLEPYGCGGPFVMIEDGVWRMWYWSAVDFMIENGKPLYYYHIKYAESDDGIHWDRQGIVAIDFKYPAETRIARPCVIKEDGIYKMWYSYAIGHGGYRIGYAESDDGIKWERMDEKAGIDVSPLGWDSKMVAYPCVFKHRGKKYMLYNGNNYGKTGFGLAVWED